ncbi:hypothetical protein AA313_de0206622 [Arthrobotrys entomopaga]|nr:hypothetical protein AA313_de0206622 [Arthrobotrys entomopaga]
MSFGFFTSRFRPKPLPGTALYSSTTNRSGPVLKYDDQSGNLFTEETFRTPSKCLSLLDRPTFAEREILFLKYPRTNPRKQDPTLFNLCRLVVLQHIESLTPDVLAYLPWHYGKILWEDLIHATADSFTVFKNFCEVYGTEPDFNPGNRELLTISHNIPQSRHLKLPMSERQPWTPLYIPYFSSKSTAWLVNLSLTGKLDIWELTELTALRNLVSLSISFPFSTSGYPSLGRVFKNWVTNKQSFENLRVIRCGARGGDNVREQQPSDRIRYAITIA